MLWNVVGEVVIWSGDIYTQNPDTKIVYKWTRKKKIVFTVYNLALIAVVLGLISLRIGS